MIESTYVAKSVSTHKAAADDRWVFGIVEENKTREWAFQDLFEAARRKTASQVSIEDLEVLDKDVWFDGTGRSPTLRAVAEEIQRVEESDLDQPLIAIESLGLIDGTHRLVKAYLNGVQQVPVVRFSLDELKGIRHTTKRRNEQ